MTDLEAPLTADQQKLMAFVDDEMSPQERTEFEAQLARDPNLAAEAASFQCLTDITSSMTLAEPTDHEMRRFWASFYNRGEWQLGWILLLLGLGVLGCYGLGELFVSPLHWVLKTAAIAALLGSGILVFNTLRLKLRTRRFDRYRGVMR